MRTLIAFLTGITTLWATAVPPVGPTSEHDNGAAAVDSLSLPTGRTDWVDPVHAVPVNTGYVLYPTPARGEGTYGSCLVYTPGVYSTDTLRRFPVIYYLHGGTGNQREASWLIPRLDAAIRDGRMEPVILVSPQALPIGWYVNANESDSKVLSGPIHDVLIDNLISYIDSTYRTVAGPAGRGIEGFSMGGRGALALAFSHPEVFGAVSSIAGAVVNWDEEPLQRALECTFGDVGDPFSRLYFDAWHPATAVCRNARGIKSGDMRVRLYVGDRDRLYEENGTHITERFHNLLERLGIPHTYTIVPGADHNPTEIFDDSVNPYDFTFWNTAFGRAASGDAVPREIVEFADSALDGSKVVELTVSPEANGDHYLVRFADGLTMKFNEHFKWISVKSANGTVPESLVHAGIRGYLDSHRPDARIISIDKVPRVGYDVRFADGESLVFNTRGELEPGR